MVATCGNKRRATEDPDQSDCDINVELDLPVSVLDTLSSNYNVLTQLKERIDRFYLGRPFSHHDILQQIQRCVKEYAKLDIHIEDAYYILKKLRVKLN